MRVWVTGVGVVTGIGIGVEENIAALRAGRQGMGKVTLFPTELDVPVSEVKRSNEELKQLLGLDVDQTFSRTTLLGMLAAKEAVENARLQPQLQQIGFISSTSVGGMDRSEHFYPAFKTNPNRGKMRDIASHDCAASTQQIASYLELSGYTTISTACSSAANAIMLGARLIRSGRFETVVVGGTDALCRFTLNGFHSLMILDKEHCRPFDESRAGLNLGEGAGYLVLQSEQAVLATRPYCELTGYANANDAYHQTGSSPQGNGPFRSMSQALAMSGVGIEEIDYINVHGTGTAGNDASESSALQRLFGAHVPPFSSVKPFIGHTLGASQGIEAVYSVLSISRGFIYPNLNFRNAIRATGLLPETSFREGLPIRHVLCNSFGFGGNDTSLLFSKAEYDEAPQTFPPIASHCHPAAKSRFYIQRSASLLPDGEPNYKEIITDANLRRRMSRVVRMGVACGLECLGTTASEKIQAIITATGLGCLADTEKFMNAIIDQKEQMLNPTPFIQSTFNTMGAQIALIRQIEAYNMTYVHRGLSFESALVDSMTRITEGDEKLLVGAVDEQTPTSHILQQRLGLLRGIQAGEGAQFFLLSSRPTETTVAELCDVETFSLPTHRFHSHTAPNAIVESETIRARIDRILQRNGLTTKEVDWFVTGENGNPDQDRRYKVLKEQEFRHALHGTFKEECGEYSTASSYALWKIANTLKDPKHPARVALLYNCYQNNDHSLILIKKNGL